MPGGQPEWCYPRRSILHIENENDPHGHGSCVASKAAGKKTGVSKNTRLIVLKSSNWMYKKLSAFENVRDDSISKGRRGRSVIVYSRSSYPNRYATTAPIRNLPAAWQAHRIFMEVTVKEQVSW